MYDLQRIPLASQYIPCWYTFLRTKLKDFGSRQTTQDVGPVQNFQSEAFLAHAILCVTHWHTQFHE